MTKLPRTFCVTLKETPLRTKGFMEVAQAAGLEVTPFYGVLGTRLGLLPKFPNEIESPNSNIMLNERAIGCNLSHLLLWNVLKYQPEDEFLIFEDDAAIPVNFAEQFQKVYSLLPPDWQMAYVGWVRYGRDVIPVVINEGLSIRIPTATHAYMVKKSVLEYLCNSMLPFQSNIDLTIVHRLLPKIRYYVFDPSLVSQRSYLNTIDSVWTSLVYDWENDLYGCRKDIIKSLALGTGWHEAERDDKNVWRWSTNLFSITVPPHVTSITLECNTPIENILELGEGDTKQVFPLKIGDNSLTVQINNAETVNGKMIVSFIPSQHEPQSSDQRVLGICLRRVLVNMGDTSIAVEMKELSAPVPPPISFKL